MMSACAINFADMNGNSSTGFSGTMELSERHQQWHDEIKKVWDFFDTIPFYRMSPRQDLVDEGYCLAEPSKQYLVYLTSPATVNITVTDGPYRVQWFNAPNPTDRRLQGTTKNGLNLQSPTDGDDWLLYLAKAK